MEYLSKFYLGLAVIAVVFLQIPGCFSNPTFKATEDLAPDVAITEGSLKLVVDEPLFPSREVWEGQTIRWKDLMTRPHRDPRVGQVPLAIDIKLSAATQLGLTSGTKLSICPGSIPGEFVRLECGLGVEDCLAIFRVDREDREKAKAEATVTLKQGNDCG